MLPHSRSLQYISSTLTPKLDTISDFHIDIDTVKSTVLDTVLSRQGNHGVDSDLHKWSLQTDGNLKQAKPQTILIDFR